VHDVDYRASLKDFSSFLECLTQKIIEVDDTIPELPVKDIVRCTYEFIIVTLSDHEQVFRIHRDVRFSKDQTPYKTAFSAAWSRTGRKGPYAAYYVQIKPNGGSVVGKKCFISQSSLTPCYYNTLQTIAIKQPHVPLHNRPYEHLTKEEMIRTWSCR
jgi:uncharacterized protein (DUF2461 family)